MITLKDYIERYYKIVTKQGSLEPFIFNDTQKAIYNAYKKCAKEKRIPRFIILKARQMGVSTFTEALITALTQTTFHTNSLIVAHESEASSNIFRMAKRFIDNLPIQLQPARENDNAKRLAFNNAEKTGLDSAIRVIVQGDSSRSSTNKLVHISELAFWNDPEVSMTALMQSVPNELDSLVIIESTANGFNYFYDLWKKAERGENDFIPLFFPWFKEKTYVMPYHKEKLTDKEKELKKDYKLTNEQIMWRRWCIANNCSGDERIFMQEYPSNPDEAFITSGDSVFNIENVQSRLRKITKPIKKGYFKYKYDGLDISHIEWVDDKKSFISIYKEPTQDFTALGGDTAGEGTDYFTAHVLDREGNQLATYWGKDDEDLYAKQIYCLGTYYKSVIGLEVNFSTYPTQELKRLRYPWLYIREVYDKIHDDIVKSYGFKTTSLTRPIIINQLVEIVRETPQKIVDKPTLEEMLTFVKLNGKPQASQGAHDDLVMGLAIAYEVMSQIPKQRKETKEEKDDDLNFFNF